MHIWQSKKVIKCLPLWKKLPRNTPEERLARNELLISFGLKPEPKTVRGAVDKDRKSR
jgi:hypothetical protein